MTQLQRLTRCRTPREFWSKHREASLNWLALGLLLAAWNASDNEMQNDLRSTRCSTPKFSDCQEFFLRE